MCINVCFCGSRGSCTESDKLRLKTTSVCGIERSEFTFELTSLTCTSSLLGLEAPGYISCYYITHSNL